MSVFKFTFNKNKKRNIDMGYKARYNCNNCSNEVEVYNPTGLKFPKMLLCKKCNKVINGLSRQDGIEEYSENYKFNKKHYILGVQSSSEYKKKVVAFVNEAWEDSSLNLSEWYSSKEQAIRHIGLGTYTPNVGVLITHTEHKRRTK